MCLTIDCLAGLDPATEQRGAARRPRAGRPRSKETARSEGVPPSIEMMEWAFHRDVGSFHCGRVA